ncbi:MAG: hypothetical protein LH628_22815 [Microcoleus sp. CAN_BIN18]|nr:hypothetical protein [Microcoleus sp. CAN_BIN18]
MLRTGISCFFVSIANRRTIEKTSVLDDRATQLKIIEIPGFAVIALKNRCSLPQYFRSRSIHNLS